MLIIPSYINNVNVFILIINKYIEFPLRLHTLASLVQALYILAERFCIIRKYEGHSYDTKNNPERTIL